jgi:aminopeptidase N
MIRYVLALSLALLAIAARADNRSDTFDILHTQIDLDVTDFAGKTISGSAELTITPKVYIDRIHLDLLALTVDSVKQGNTHLTFSHDDTLLGIILAFAYNPSDTFQVRIWYQGSPVRDGGGTGWGGWYWSGTYAWNLGVGFQADPHNYGRVWFPCLDNFQERCTYSFAVTTDTTKKAFCNGLMDTVINNMNGTQTWHWTMHQTIPSYLTSVAVADYVTLYDNLQGIPIELGVRAADSTKLKGSFVHLEDAIIAFEEFYGPHRFDRIGFNVVPFNSGAMEHATNIAYPLNAVDGTTTRETLMAHELAHHWWGDLITTVSQDEMWINEGWASYSEALFTQHVYGDSAYQHYVLDNHAEVLRYAHLRDGGYLTLDNVGHADTYGDHSYNKGADAAHTLRGQLRDSLFALCISSFMASRAFDDVSSVEFKDHLSVCAGRDMSSFFETYIHNPGFVHFSVDSIEYSYNGSDYDVSIFVRQRNTPGAVLMDSARLDLYIIGEASQSRHIAFWMSGGCMEVQTSTTFEPSFAVVDLYAKFSDARVQEVDLISAPKNGLFADGVFEIDIQSLPGTALIYVAHNFIKPDRMINPPTGWLLSDYHYWTVKGVIPPGSDLTAVVPYDGRPAFDDGDLDDGLNITDEDSVMLLWRPGAGHEWSIYPHYVVNTLGTKGDGRGRFELSDVIPGEYTTAYRDPGQTDTLTSQIPASCATVTAMPTQSPQINNPLLYPNPTDGMVMIKGEWDSVAVHDLAGRLIYKGEGKPFDTSDWAAGTYVVNLNRGKQQQFLKLVVLD